MERKNNNINKQVCGCLFLLGINEHKIAIKTNNQIKQIK